MLFQTNAPEYDKLFLNKLILGLGIRIFFLLTDRKFKVELLFDSLILNKSVRYSGAILFDTLYITFAFCRNTLSENDNMFRRFWASSKLEYSFLNISSHALRCNLVSLSVLEHVDDLQITEQ